jgi:hypothetical protein
LCVAGRLGASPPRRLARARPVLSNRAWLRSSLTITTARRPLRVWLVNSFQKRPRGGVAPSRGKCFFHYCGVGRREPSKGAAKTPPATGHGREHRGCLLDEHRLLVRCEPDRGYRVGEPLPGWRMSFVPSETGNAPSDKPLRLRAWTMRCGENDQASWCEQQATGNDSLIRM